ncbi:SRPBCC family protein [Psychromicrobium xiongbiense]|uniref:SRPBCC family protein n=1 Tax=Psychromicrobium xiongbiense TaxID=3051184 RepID=UPI0025570F56|nr:SRPBCC domain-containing protein [Psychromicrobium sp. YIM S02556]
MTGITAEGIEIDREFAASPAAVFSAWTAPESFARWFGGREVHVPLDGLDYRAEVGRAWSAMMVLPDGNTIDWAGEFLEVDPPTRLVMTLTDRPAEGERAVLTLDLTPTASGTRMRMTQQTPGFSPEQRQGTIAGWQTFFEVLAEIAES